MKIKHHPATRLPYRAVGHRVMKYSTAAIVVADCQYIETDAAYLAHAANAYPKLVEELRVLAGKYETLQARLDEKSGYTAQFQCSAVLEALALLRELGEAK